MDIYYSVLKAITGSFLLAALAGIIPPIKVKIILNIINIPALLGFKIALILTLFVALNNIAFIIAKQIQKILIGM